MPEVISVNVGLPRTVTWAGRQVTSAIWKVPADGRVPVRGVNLDGDDQADRRVHGGPDKAVYAYAMEDYDWWTRELGSPTGIATFGENLTTRGIDLAQCVIGQRWQVGTAVLEVAQPREPCFKLGMRMGDSGFVQQFEESGRSGAYLRITAAGEIGRGDEIVMGDPPAHGLKISDLVQASFESPISLFERIASTADVPMTWRQLAQRRIDRVSQG
jgi:MOSC domain-containing protein YiiM